MIYDIACSKHITPTLNHLKIIARRAQQCLINICRCSSSKEVLQKHFKMKLAGPSDMILDLSTPPLYRVWTNIFFVSHRNQLSDRSENLSKHFQIYRKFEQTFLNLQKILANICKFAAEDVENLKWGRILSLLPYRRRQAKQRLVSEFSFDFPPFSHFLTISKQFPNNFQTISKQRLNSVNSLPPSTRCAIFPNSRPNSGQDLITICNVLKKFSFDTHTTRRIFVKKQKGEPFFCTDHQMSTP